jgi:hypothetical protein
MSLKTFHIIFVTISTLLCLFLALFAFVFTPEVSSAFRVLGVVGIVGAIVMPIYGVCFYRKAASIHI